MISSVLRLTAQCEIAEMKNKKVDCIRLMWVMFEHNLNTRNLHSAIIMGYVFSALPKGFKKIFVKNRMAANIFAWFGGQG